MLSSKTNTERNIYYDSESDDENETNANTLHFAKLDILKKLGKLADRGVKLTTYYDLDSKIETMKYDYMVAKTKYLYENNINSLKPIQSNVCYGIKQINETIKPVKVELKDKQIDTNINNMEINIEI